MNLKDSETKDNLMRAFAGESQARNRYTIAAAQAEQENLHVIAAVFQFTADQEREHAEVFYQYLTELSGENIAVDGAYPVNISANVAQLLRMAQHNEYEEHDDVYQKFAAKADEEGFGNIAAAFRSIADIEKVHGSRFGELAELLEQGKLFVSDVETAWMCLECGNIIRGTKAPEQCPVCHSNQGFFVRLELAPYTSSTATSQS
jgi:rubrerythrin